MVDAKNEIVAEEAKAAEQASSFKDFLERTHPSVKKLIRGLWKTNPRSEKIIAYPEIRLHCRLCEGERTFRLDSKNYHFQRDIESVDTHPVYRCGDCRRVIKKYALQVSFGEGGDGFLYKYGEQPPFGIPVPNRVLRLFGKDAKLFDKGRQCEDLGYGIAAFAYYRRVVENHRSDLFDEIIKVCKTVGAPEALVEELTTAKAQISFAKSIEKIKTGLPEGLLINGHNPLQALHGALSVGLHNETDEDCLEKAQAVRLVLSDLVERFALLKKDDKELNDAVQRLLAK